MQGKKYTLGACLLLSTVGLAENQTYVVKNGDTISGIAGRFQVSTKEISELNHLGNSNKLKLGLKLSIPSSKNVATKKPTKSTPSGYVVHPGENDVTIARKFGITDHDLRAMNPGIKWSRLQIGTALRVPGHYAVAKAEKKAVAVPGKVVVAHQSAPMGTYKVKNGENDWIIASRVGLSTKKLKELNPNVDWQHLQIGKVLRVPGSTIKAVVASAPVIKSRYAVFAKDAVNVRSGGKTDSKKVAEGSIGDRVVVLDRREDWYKVRLADGSKGWVRGDMLKATTAPKLVAAIKRHHEEPAAHPAHVARLDRGSRNTRGGHSSRPSVDAPVSSVALLDDAYSMRGTRYVWGASSRSGVDCSGFSSLIYRSQGVKLPRTSRDQSHVGSAVSKGDLKPGDLVFFKTAGRNHINHVGIYAGDGKFIHASSANGQVRVDHVDSGYYSRQFVTARRVASNLKAGKHHSAAAKVVAKHEEEYVQPAVEPAAATTDSEPKPAKNSGADQIIK